MPRWTGWAGAAVLLAGLCACAGVARAADAIALDRLGDRAEIELPESNREPLEAPVPVSARWRLATTVGGVRTWEAPIPVHTRSLFFHQPPDDMAVLRRDPNATDWAAAADLTHVLLNGGEGVRDTWSFTDRSVLVRRPVDAGPPQPGEYGVIFTRALEREAALNLATSGVRPQDFAFRTLQVDETTRQGIFLPAPARVSLPVQVPEGAVLDLDPVLAAPEAADPGQASDGARLRVFVEVGDERTEILDVEPRLGEWGHQRLDLARWGGQEVRLAFETDPNGDTLFDYVFVAEPTVLVPQARPRRVVMIFVDTLREDHLSLYGYDRTTTPAIDEWARAGAVFEQARSVAPWTLPATRTLLSGDQPEVWGQAPTLQQEFAEAGWATAFFAGNIYLSANFDMADGWGVHRCSNWPRAQVQVDRALAFLEANEDRDAFVVLHFMDLHLPYDEPFRYRHRFAGDPPESLPAWYFLRFEISRVERYLGESGKQYVRDRYDNNVAYVDDQVKRFLGALSTDDTVVLLSDHGEEFWDHGGFEHGHSLYDELLHVPLVVVGPGITPGRVSTPVSLLDVAPTIARAAGLPTDRMAGWPLQDLADGSRMEDFAGRPLGFGRPLYGDRQWGAMQGDQKYVTGEGKERVYDLGRDPEEDIELSVGAAGFATWRERLARAVGRPVRVGFRLQPSRARTFTDIAVELAVPGGVHTAWMGADPTNSSRGFANVTGEIAHGVWKGGSRTTRELFVFPERPAHEVASELELTVLHAGSHEAFRPKQAPRSPDDGFTHVIMRGRVRGRSVSITYAVSPTLDETLEELSGYNAEVREDLKALGYVEDDEGE